MSMAGKMSATMRETDSTPMTTSKIAITAMV